MIISEDGYGKITGNTIEVLADYTLISNAFLRNDPEIFVAVHMAFAEEATEMLAQLDAKKLEYFIKRAEEFVRDLRTEETSND